MWLCLVWLVPQPEIPPTPNAVDAQSLKHWTTREVPGLVSLEDSENTDVHIFYHPNSHELKNSMWTQVRDPSSRCS